MSSTAIAHTGSHHQVQARKDHWKRKEQKTNEGDSHSDLGKDAFEIILQMTTIKMRALRAVFSTSLRLGEA